MSKQRLAGCCQVKVQEPGSHSDHSRQLHRTNRIVGQVAGVKRMIENRDYCPKIIIQIQAIRSALKALESSILDRHLRACVMDAFSLMNHKDQAKKLDELMDLFRRN